MQRRFAIYDVFSDKTMAGNQLGVVYDCDGSVRLFRLA